MSNTIRSGILLIMTMGLMACASAGSLIQKPTLEQKLADRNYQLGEPVDRIMQYTVDSWSYLDREHVIMQTAPSTYYLVSLRRPCYGLTSAETIGFTTTTSHLTPFDKLVVRSSGRMIEQCYISALHKLAKIPKKLAAR